MMASTEGMTIAAHAGEACRHQAATAGAMAVMAIVTGVTVGVRTHMDLETVGGRAVMGVGAVVTGGIVTGVMVGEGAAAVMRIGEATAVVDETASAGGADRH